MTDLPSSLGIEAVECVAEGGPSVTVRVTGRWRRRRPEQRGQATLVVETETGRQRFPAMPEPPSLTGAAPGTWRMSFSVPAGLAPALPGRTFLQLGGVMVPLPIGEVEIAAESPGPEVLEERVARGSELAAETARRRAAELAADVERLERALAEAHEQSERLREEVGERDRRVRAAEQHVHSERALRADLEHQLARETRRARHDLGALHERVADLERELVRMRRAVDEAQHLAAAAQAARAEAERRRPERTEPERTEPDRREPEPAPAGDPHRAALTRRELELHQSAGGARPADGHARAAEFAVDRGALRLEALMVRQRGEQAGSRLAALEAELSAARAEIEVQRRQSARAYEAIELVRAELRRLHATGVARPAAAAVVVAREPIVPGAEPAQAEPVQAERLSEALTRLRERTPPPADERTPAPADESTATLPGDERPATRPADESTATPPAEPLPTDPPAPGRPAKPWLEAPFRTMAGKDPTAAGRLLLALLPAQAAADPHAVAYDLVLSDLVCAQVTVGSGGVHVERADAPRPRVEVDFQLIGDAAAVARLLVAGRLRRRLPSRRRARVRGERRRVAALDHLVRARLTLGDLIAAGVKLDPLLTLTLAATAIDPDWTAGERFAIAHRDPADTAPGAYLTVRDAKPPLASSEPPHGPVTMVVVCPADDLLGVLAGCETRIEGMEQPLALVRQWLDRAQSG